jgi:hypothetical protein
MGMRHGHGRQSARMEFLDRIAAWCCGQWPLMPLSPSVALLSILRC